MGLLDGLGKALLGEAAVKITADFLREAEAKSGPDSLEAALARKAHNHARAYAGEPPIERPVFARSEPKASQDRARAAPTREDIARNLRNAANKGNPVAMAQLGHAYLAGDGVRQNPSEGVKWFGRAALTRHPLACHLAGKGLEQFGAYREAAQSYLTSAQRGNADGMWEIALCYAQAKGVAKDEQQFERWFNAAVAAGQPDAVALKNRHEQQSGHQDQQDHQNKQQEQQHEHHEQQNKQREQSASGFDGTMTRKQALEILELKEGATREEITAAFKRMMIKNHPDQGGSTFIAKLLNQARAVLLH